MQRRWAARGLLVPVLVGAALVPPRPAEGQYLFGQNKVVYAARDWRVLSTPHLDLYYYAGEERLAEYLADFAERTCVEYETLFRHRFQHRIPLILYATHHDFKQTNVIDALISDYVGGFTEYLRGRVAVPHTGSMTQLRNVTRHELVHAFVNDKLARLMNAKRRYGWVPPPLWFSEGIAEYVAAGRPDAEARMFLRDLVVNDGLVELPDIWRISGTFLMYKEGESLVGYIATRFGRDALVQLLENWWASDRFEVLLQQTLGISAAELNRDWKRFLQRRYAPAVMAGEWPEEGGVPLTRGRGLHSRPAVVPGTVRPDGRCDFVYLGSASGSVDLVVAQAFDGPPPGRDPQAPRYAYHTLLRGGRSDRVEAIPPFASGPEVHGRQVAFTCKSGARDALVVFDLERRTEVARFKFDPLVTLASPTWSPDGTEIVFAGLDRRGWPDLYRLRLADGTLERLTYDPADDRDPDWSDDGRCIAWSSDRAAAGRDGVYHIWMLDLATGEATALTSGAHEDATPSWGPDGRSLLFTSDAGGQSDVYLLEPDGGPRLTRLTATLGGLFAPQWTPDGRGFLCSSFANTSFNVVRFGLDRRRSVPAEGPAPDVAAAPASQPPSVTAGVPSDWVRTAARNRFPSRDYTVRFGLDFVRSTVAFDPDFMSATGGQLGFTDMLGDHQLFLHVSNSADQLTDFWEHLNLGVTYTNLARRLNYSVGAFHLTSVYDPRLDRFRYERRYGALFGVSYPLSRFRRIESSVVGRAAERDPDEAALLGVNRRTFLLSNFTSFVHDNTLWTVAGPTDGTRFNVTVGHTFDLGGTDRGGTSAHLDLRHYRPLPLRTVLASRLVGRSNWGDDVQFFYLGGPFDLRGYRYRSLFARRTLLANGELRFPLVDRLVIGLPFNSIEMGGFRGALFSDAAYLGVPFSAWYGSLGAGVELGLGAGFVARWDMGRTHDFQHFDPGSFSRFFLGWDF